MKELNHQNGIGLLQCEHAGRRLYACDVFNKTYIYKCNMKDTSLYILASVLIHVLCVIKHLVERLIFNYTKLHIVANVLIRVVCVIRHSGTSVA
jgi:hypothetical protein